MPSPAQGLLHDSARGHHERAVQGPQGPPGPPGPPGNTRWFGSHGNATDLVEYIRCKIIKSITKKSRSNQVLIQTVTYRTETTTITKHKCTFSISPHMYFNLAIK